MDLQTKAITLFSRLEAFVTKSPAYATSYLAPCNIRLYVGTYQVLLTVRATIEKVKVMISAAEP